MKELRPHQTRAVEMLRGSLRLGKRRPILCLSTGSGKTVIAASIIRMAREKGKRVAFLVDAVSLIDQTVTAFYAEGLHSMGVHQADHPMYAPHHPIQICSIQTLTKRGMPPADLVIVDECHVTYKWLIEIMASDEWAKVPFIGLSATPWANGLGNHYDDLIMPISMQELIDAGFLCPIRVFAASKPDLSTVKTVAGEYHEGQLSGVMQDDGLIADVVETWLALSERRPTLAFAVDCAHAQKIQERFAKVGVEFGYVDAYTERVDRKRMAERMAKREIAGIVSVGTMIKGVDLEVGCITDAAPTKSPMRHVQKLGRGMRVNPEAGPDCIVLDHASNCIRLGFPMDIYKPELCTKKKGDKADDAIDKPAPEPSECPKCKRLRPKGVKTCPSCGFEAVVVSKIEEKPGELKELKKGPSPAQKERFYCELLDIQKRRGKGSTWADGFFKAKFGHWPAKKHGLSAIAATPETEGYVRHRQIAYAKRKAA